MHLEFARRSDVVGISPNDAALLRLATSLLVEQTTNGSSKRYLSLHSLATLTGADHGPFRPAETGPPALDESALAGLGKNTT